jgi:3-hydroxymyristoyl/3-hydroxydecanoyl-(acyl carrier protein) dehydratase
VHLTGAAGFVHAYYLLGLRHRDGWVGFGTHIHRAVFRKLITPGEDFEMTLQATRLRPGRDRYMVRYDVEVRSDGARCYQGDQSAAWMREAVSP